MKIGGSISGACFSDCRSYRYALWRIWEREKPAMLFVGMNPSKADEIHDDPTVVKCAGYAQNWGYGGLYIGNLFALRSSNPAEILVHQEDAVGNPENDKTLAEMRQLADMVLLGWGRLGEYQNRHKAVLELLGNPVYCLSVTKNGQPTHPLYLPYAYEPQDYRAAT